MKKGGIKLTIVTVLITLLILSFTIHAKQEEAYKPTTEVFIKKDFQTSSTIQLQKQGKVTKILKCENYNSETNTCPNWEPTDIPFSDKGSYIELQATELTTYAGGDIIAIDAIHLDESYNQISNIFDDISEIDNQWSEKIYENEIVRVTFEKELNSGNYIDIYADSQGTIAYFDIYEAGTNHKVGKSAIIEDPELQYIKLKGLTKPTNTFDFKIKKLITESNDQACINDCLISCKEEPYKGCLKECNECISITSNPDREAYINFDYIHDDIINSTQADGLIVYGESGTATPRYRIWNSTNNYGSELSANSVGTDGVNDLTWIITKGSHERDEIILGTLDKGTSINTQIFYPNSTWSPIQQMAPTTENAAYRAFDIAYEQVSGDALIVYDTSDAPDTTVGYRIWNGINYTSEATLTTTLSSSEIHWVKLISKKRTDEIMLLLHNTDLELYAVPWNGTGFDTNKQVILTTNSASDAIDNFNFAWEGSSGQGLVVYAEGNNLVYATYDGSTWTNPVGTISLGQNLETPRFCSEKSSDYIGLIWQDGGNDVGVRVWDGTGFLTGQPTEDSGTEPSGDDNVNVDCAWLNSTDAIFGFVDRNALSVDYIFFTKSNSWSENTLNNAPSTINFASDDIHGLRFTQHPKTQELMMVAQDIVEDLTVIRWDGSNFVTISTSPLELNLEVTNGDQEGAQFDWYRYDPPPNVSSIQPDGASYSSGEKVWINATILDNIATEVVSVNITLPNGTINQITGLTDPNGDNIYNTSFVNTIESGTYTITFIANDTSVHKNINQTETTTFTVIASTPPSVTNLIPTNGTYYSLSSLIQVGANVTSTGIIDSVIAYVYYPNGSSFYLSLNNETFSNKFNTTYNSPALPGMYNISFIANDTDGNTNGSEVTFFHLNDTFAPQITAILPVNGSNYNATNVIEISVNVTDDYQLETITATLSQPNGTSILLTLNNNTFSNKFNNSFTIGNLTGMYNITYFANDTHNNINNSELTYFNVLDLVVPVITTNGCRPVSANLTQTIECNATITDDIQLYSVQANITIPNGTVQSLTTNNITLSMYNTTFSNTLQVGEYTITWWANDTSNNMQQATDTFNISDVTAPILTAFIPTNGTYYSLSNTIQIATNVTDNYNLDTVQATIYYPNNSNLQLTLTNNTYNNKFNTSFTLPTLTGMYNITYFANDTSNNINNTEVTYFHINDTVNPSVTALRPTKDTTFSTLDTIEISINVTDDYQINTVQANLTYPNSTASLLTLNNNTFSNKFNTSFTIPLTIGNYDITFLVTDTNNNLNNSEATNFTATSATPPSITTNGCRPVSANLTQTIECNATITDDIQLYSVQANITIPNGTVQTVQVNNLTLSMYNTTFSNTLQVGEYTITWWANDTSNNMQQATDTFNISDVTPPQVTAFIPTNGTYYSLSNAIQIATNVIDNYNLDTVQATIYYPNNSNLQLTLTNNTYNNKFNTSFTLPTLTGMYNITYFANDTSNNINNTEVTYFHINDTVNPSVTAIKPVNGTYFGLIETIDVSINVTDDYQINSLTATLSQPNGTSILLTLTNSTGFPNKFNNSFTTPYLPGMYNITYLVTDTNNNINNSELTYFHVNDTIAPAVTINLPPQGSSFGQNANVSIATTVTDEIQVDTVLANITIPNGTIDTITLNLDAGQYKLHFNNTATLGSYEIKVIANDTNNNVNQSVKRNFTIQDTGKPIVELVYPTNGLTLINNNINFICNATDATGLSNMTLYHNISGSFEKNQTNSTSGTNNQTSFTINSIPDGSYLWDCEARDTSNNGAFGADNFTFTIDTKNPSVLGLRPTIGSVYNVSNVIQIAANVTDLYGISVVKANITYPNNTVVEKTLIQTEGDKFNTSHTIPALIGEYNITFYARDSNTNVNLSEKTNFTVNDVNSISITPNGCRPVGANLTQTIKCNATITDDIQLYSVQANITIPNGTVQTVQVNNLTLSMYNTTFSNTLQVGEYTITWWANDTSNNMQQATDTFNISDVTPPQVTSFIPTNGTYYSLSNTIQIATNVTDNYNLDTVQATIYYPNNSNLQLTLTNNTYNNKFNNTFTLPTLTGMYNITYLANDTSNNINNTEVTYFHINDTVNPSVTAIIPTKDTTFSTLDTIEISINVTDDYQINTVQANLTYPNSTSSLLTLNNNTFSNKFNTSFTIPLAIGNYNISFLVTDTNNNLNNSEATNFTATSATAPTITLNGCRPVSANLTQTIECNATITDDIQLYSVQANITIPNGTVQSLTTNNLTLSMYNTTFSNTLQVGEYTITWWANDTSNNMQQATDTFNISDVTPPQVTGQIPNNTLYNISNSIEIGVNVTDNYQIETVFANITYPNNSGFRLPLNNQTFSYKFNATFVAPGLIGNYDVAFFANDTSNNLNNTRRTNFTINDTLPPQVTSLKPIADSQSNAGTTIEISINVTDDYQINTVQANLTYPNSTSSLLILNNNTYNNKFNTSFTIPLAIGNYNISFLVTDTNNNINNSEATNFTAVSTSSPVITTNGCRPVSANLTQTIECNATITDDIQLYSVQANITIPNGTVQTVQVNNLTLSMYNTTFSNTLQVGEYTITWWANDTSNNMQQATDTFTISDITLPTITLNAPANNTNQSSRTVNFNFTTSDNYYNNLSCSIVLDSVTNKTNSLTLTNTPTTLTTINIPDGNHNWKVTCIDPGNNQNTSESRLFTIDNGNPVFVSLSLSPSDEYSLDPGVSLNITANVTENLTTINTVILQYRLTNESAFTNISMVYDSTTSLYNATITANKNGIYSFRIFANDSSGNQDISNFVNKTIEYDYNWTRTPSSFEPVNATFNQTVTLGNLTINNSGDFELNFTIRSDSNETTYNTSSTNITIPADGIKIIQINETATNTGIKSVALNITSHPNGIPPSAKTTGTVIVAPGAPILSTTFLTPSEETLIVEQGETNVEFVSKVRNVGDGESYNVTLSFDIPSNWTITFGEINETFEELFPGEEEEASIEVTIPSNFEIGKYNITANATGVNASGTSIESLGFVFGDLVVVTVNEETIELGGIGGAGGSGGATGGTGGVGGAGGAGGVSRATFGETINTEETITIVRGKTDSIPIKVTNYYENSYMDNIQLEVQGFLSQYVKLTPISSINRIAYGEIKEYNLNLFAPGYLEEQNHELTIKITARIVAQNPQAAGFNSKPLTELRNILFKVLEVGREEVEIKLIQAEEDLSEMKKEDIPSSKVEDLLEKARLALELEDYIAAKKFTERIAEIKRNAIETNNILNEVKEGIEDAKSKWLKVPEAEKALDFALLAFEKEDFVSALQRAKEAQLTLILETKGKVNVLWFLSKYWWALILGTLVSGFIAFLTYKKLIIAIITQRLKNIAKEEATIYQLMEEAQISHLRDGEISSSEYNKITKQYEARLNKIKQIRIKLRNKRVGILRTEKQLESLHKEETELVEEIKKLQIDYLQKGILTRTKFMNAYEVDKTRLAEVEEEKELLRQKLEKKKINRKYKLLTWINKLYLKIESLFIKEKSSFDLDKAGNLYLEEPEIKEPEALPKPVEEKVEIKVPRLSILELVKYFPNALTSKEIEEALKKEKERRINDKVEKKKKKLKDRYGLKQDPKTKKKRGMVYKHLREEHNVDAKENE